MDLKWQGEFRMAARPLRDEKGRILPGQVLNPNGRSKEPTELTMLRKAVHNEIKLFALKVLGRPYDELLEEHYKDNLTTQEKMFVTLAATAISDASIKHFELVYKIIGLNLNSPVTLRHETENTDTGLEKIPTEKLEKIKKIWDGE